MNGVCDKFLTRAGLSQQEHGRITRGYRFDQLQHLPKRRTSTHDCFNNVRAANLPFQMALSLREPAFDFAALERGQAIRVDDCHLPRRLHQEMLYFEDELRTAADCEGIVGQSSTLRQVLQLVE